MPGARSDVSSVTSIRSSTRWSSFAHRTVPTVKKAHDEYNNTGFFDWSTARDENVLIEIPMTKHYLAKYCAEQTKN
jgi:hypothetical protein